MRTLVITNPVAGGGAAKRWAPVVADYLRQQEYSADFVESTGSTNVRERAAAAATAGYSRIAVLGGDGTFHHTVAGALEAHVQFAFIPTGNGNDIARCLGIPDDPIEAARLLVHGATKSVDVLRANFTAGQSEIFLGAGGMGLDAEAARLVHGRFNRLPGVLRYVVSALVALATYEPLRVNLELDGAQAQELPPALFAAVANSPEYGSRLRIAPDARMDDGLLDVTMVGAIPWPRIVEAIFILLRTGDIRWPEIHRFRARRIRMQSERPALFHGDGEILGESPVAVEVLPGAIQVIVPKT
ncbi:MAG: diacylglycerol kinase family lipid kinase [Acidobacteria bacterium]|nr:diacylglycerol kinase family lipid kinase [Acidobacteriota bacterium]